MPDPVGTPPGTARRETRRQLRASRKRLDRLARDIARLDERVARLLSLGQDDPDLGARLDRLVPVLDPGRIAAHARAAIEGAAFVEAPVPHATVVSLFPDDVYRALVDAVPPRACFSAAGGGRLDLPVPPAVAPVDAVVTWRFIAGLVRESIGPALVETLRPALERHVRALGGATLDEGGLVASLGRLVRREPGYVSPGRRPGPWDFLTTMVWLPGADGNVACGAEIHGPGGSLPVAGRPNTALVVLDAAGALEYQAVPPDGTACVSYEFPIGPDAAGRRALGLGARPASPTP